jgi:protein TonB
MDRPLHDARSAVPQKQPYRRAVLLVVVGLIHVAIIYGLAVGLATGVLQKTVQEIKVAVEQPKEEKAPPPPPPDLAKPPPPVVPPPEIVIQQQAPQTVPNIQTHALPQAPSSVQEASSPVGIGRAHACGSRYYPETAIRLNHEGTTGVTFTVSENGDVTDVTVTSSSGFDDLDHATIPCVMTWKYKPAIREGKPVSSQWSANVVWRTPR